MPMVGTALATAIKAAIAGVPDPKTYDAVWNTVAAAIVSYIQTNATVAVTVTSVSGVTAGVAVSGAGTGTGIIS